MKRCDDDDDGNDDDGSEKIPHAKLGAKECVDVDVEEDGHHPGTGALEKNGGLQKNSEENLESDGVDYQATNWVQQEQEQVLRTILNVAQYCNSHRQNKLLGLQEAEEFLDQGDLVDQLAPMASPSVEDKLRSRSGEAGHMC